MWGYSAECWQAGQWSARTAESGHLGPGPRLRRTPLPLSLYLLQMKHYTFVSFAQLIGHLKILSFTKTENELAYVESDIMYGYHT